MAKYEETKQLLSGALAEKLRDAVQGGVMDKIDEELSTVGTPPTNLNIWAANAAANLGNEVTRMIPVVIGDNIGMEVTDIANMNNSSFKSSIEKGIALFSETDAL